MKRFTRIFSLLVGWREKWGRCGVVITNADVTIYNRVSGNADNYDAWYKIVLCGVHVYTDHKVMPAA